MEKFQNVKKVHFQHSHCYCFSVKALVASATVIALFPRHIWICWVAAMIHFNGIAKPQWNVHINVPLRIAVEKFFSYSFPPFFLIALFQTNGFRDRMNWLGIFAFIQAKNHFRFPNWMWITKKNRWGVFFLLKIFIFSAKFACEPSLDLTIWLLMYEHTLVKNHFAVTSVVASLRVRTKGRDSYGINCGSKKMRKHFSVPKCIANRE